MYAHIHGSVLWVEDDAVVISANGLGLRIRTLPAVLSTATEGLRLSSICTTSSVKTAKPLLDSRHVIRHASSPHCSM